MNLFQAEYAGDFEEAWKRYRYSRDKGDSFKAWGQTKLLRPEREIMLLCIDEYLIDIKKTRAQQKHFSGWLRSRRWEDFLAEAHRRQAWQKLPIVLPKPAFRASDYDIPGLPTTLRPIADILRRGR